MPKDLNTLVLIIVHMYQKTYNEQILCLYCENYSKELYLREISKLAAIPLNTTQRTLEQLEKNKILKAETSGKNKYFSLNLDNIETKQALLQAEIYKTNNFLQKYSFFKTFLKDFKEISATIIIFGSFAKQKENRESDIDILIISNKRIQLATHLLPNKLHKIQLSEQKFTKALSQGETFIKKVEENHIILNNHSFFVNTMWENYARKK